MTTEEIQLKIENIRNISHDDESAHNEEDNLREEFIRYVAEGHETNMPSLAAKAKLILTTNAIRFNRWCA